MNQIFLSLLGLPLNRGVFIHKQSSESPSVFLVFTGVPGLHHSFSGIHFNLQPGFSFKIDLCDSNTLDNLENTRHQQSYPKK